MLFERLLVKNLGVFRGEHSLELMPPNQTRPIVLVGALNGSGKTTVIEALQLALYGKRAIYGWRGASSYPQYLQQLRNRHADATEPTVTQLTIKISDERSLRVRRQWSFDKDLPKEYLSVFVNGCEDADPDLSQGWEEEIERLLPARLAELFFFDGERIEKLADPIKSADVLRSAVSSLLGLDLVDHLASDLEIMRSRQRQKALSEVEQDRLGALDVEQRGLSQKLEDCRDAKGGCNSRVAEATRELQRAGLKLQSLGGDRFQNRERLSSERAAAAARTVSAERQLRELAAGSLPLTLVGAHLKRLLKSANKNAETLSRESLGTIEQVLQKLVHWAGAQGYKREIRADLSKYVRDEVRALRTASKTSPDGNWASLKGQLSNLLRHRLEANRNAAVGLELEVRSSGEMVHKLDEQIIQIPELEQLAESLRKQGAAAAMVEEAEAEFVQLEEEEKSLQRRLDVVKKMRLEQLNRAADATDAQRLAEYCDRAGRTLSEFRSNLIRVRREQLEGLILDAFRLLTRKPDLIGKISLDPETMAISLKSSDGESIVTQQLSAGERQLLAIAMLWGLARATGRPVPVVIDTPLGRLDGEHRRAIVERYFPDAGHQVLLLSTDTEVDATFSDLLDDSVAHRYLIGYDPKKRTSSFAPGYFSG